MMERRMEKARVRRTIMGLVLVATIAGGVLVNGCSRSDVAAENTMLSMSSISAKNLSEEEIQGLIQMREEEKLARDVYLTLYERWGLPIFNNIARSEQRHTDAVRNLLEMFGIPDPVTNDSVGHFSNETFTRLYRELVERGNASLLAALRVGIDIEELDIDDLEELLSQTENPYIIRVYNSLLRGSHNHLTAFRRTYRQYLPGNNESAIEK